MQRVRRIVPAAGTDRRQEFILLSDTLGLSMLTIAVNNEKPAGCTESTVFGPFYVGQSPVADRVKQPDGQDLVDYGSRAERPQPSSA